DPEILASQGRPIRPGDILILLRRRDPFAGAMIRALKKRNIPVAGADRMVLTEQLAVMDLIALTEFLLMPRDDLSLACVLKSPLFGFDDDDLFALAHAREGSLWQALRAGPGRRDDFRQAAARLESWLAQADMVAPYEFFAGLLEEHGMEMRKRLIARLGPDAADALDEFLSMALAYEQEAPVSLQGFLHYLASGEAQVKRDMEQGRDEVRIMTVHGAKGLEAEIVFLPDTCAMPAGERGGTLLEIPAQVTMPDPADHIVWVPPGSIMHDPIKEAKGARKDRELEEYNRLLYVAMTRARDRLYVCGWETGRKPPERCWYNLVWEGLKGLVREVEDADSGETVWRYESGQAAALKDQPEREAAAAAPLPQWAQTPPAAEPPVALPVAPSALPVAQGAESLPGQSVRSPLEMADGARFARGQIIHALLEHLPAISPHERAAAARKFVAARGDALGEDERERLISETMAVLQDERFAPLFGPQSLAEVPLAALLQREGEDLPAYQVTGQIDRIAILDDAILIVDYKTNRPPAQRAEDIAPAYLAQLGAYRAALRGVFAGRAIHAALLWTDTPKLMPVPEPLLDAAEAALRGRR
ncbi:MAG: double-strand break repair helicase AddA, partial [Alphaproteobacteria bacterium]